MAAPEASPTPAPPTVGLLYPGYGAEDDFPALESRLGGGVRLPLVHTSVGVDLHEVDALLDLGGAERLADGARTLLAAHAPDSVMWACTSGSFVFGWEGAHAQVESLAAVTNRPTSSTSLAFVRAAAHLGVTTVAVAASYPLPVAKRFVTFLADGGIQVTSMASHGIDTAASVGRLSPDAVVELVRGTDTTGAQAVLVPDTAMHTLGQLDALEEAAGLPVLTANQVTVWEGLRLSGRIPRYTNMGTLFR